MKAIKTIFVSVCAILLLSQCASQDDVRKLNQQIRAVNQKVDNLNTSTVTQMRQRQASSVNQLDQLSDEIIRLRSLLEENRHSNDLERTQLNDRIVILQTALEERLTANEQKMLTHKQQVAQISTGMENIQQARIKAAEQRANEAARRAEQARQRTVVVAAGSSARFVKLFPAGKKIRVGTGRVLATWATEQIVKSASAVSAESKPLQTVTAPVSSSPFAQAMEKFNNKKYKQAYQAFESILVDNPRGKESARILFYMGESLYRQGEYDLAILDYQKVISNHPKDSHTPAALLKQGMSFEKLTDNETAKIIYRKLIKDHPGTPEAEKARARQADL
jgi:tol-pal system protein YbgF